MVVELIEGSAREEDGTHKGLKTIRKRESISWSEFCKRFIKPRIGKKFGSWYILGSAKGNHLTNTALINRNALVLDVDGNVLTGILNRLLGVIYLWHTTHSHEPLLGYERYHVIIPFSHSVNAKEYRVIASTFITDNIDACSKKPTQIMFYPAISSESSEYEYGVNNEGEPLDVDKLLNRVEIKPIKKPDADPREKPGVIGDFCRAYNIPEAIDAFLSDVYEESSTVNRYHLIGANSTNGLVIYGDGLWAYSNHTNKDPAANGYCLNAYDLVRIHKGTEIIATALAARVFDDTGRGGAKKRLWLSISKNGAVSIDYVTLALEIIDEVDLFYNDMEFLRYDPALGIWKGDGELWLKQYIQESKLGIHATRNRVTETILAIQRKLYTDAPFDTGDASKILLSNGIYDLCTNSFVKGFRADIRVRTRHDIEYDPKADCPAFERLVIAIYGEDVLPFVYEWFGFCLYRSYPIKAMLMLYGKRDTGKSTLINLLQAFVGESSYSNIPLKTLCNGNDRFSMHNLIGKTLNADADAKIEYIGDGAELKQLTGGDTVMAESKGKPHVKFKNYAKLTFGLNELPTASIAEALGGRMKILETNPAQFTLTEFSRLLRQAEGERAGIFNKAVIGLQKLLDLRKFSETERMKVAALTWEKENDTVMLFIEECVERVQGVSVKRSDMYQSYRYWCTSVGRNALGKQKFNRSFERHNFTWYKKRSEEWLDVKVEVEE